MAVILHGLQGGKSAVTAMIYIARRRMDKISWRSLNGDKEVFEGKRTCFLDTSGHLDRDSFNKRAPKRNWDRRGGEGDESKREAKSKMSRRVRVKEKDDVVVVVWKEASPGAGTCSKGY